MNTVRGGVQILTNQRASRQFGLGYEHPTYILKIMQMPPQNHLQIRSLRVKEDKFTTMADIEDLVNLHPSEPSTCIAVDSVEELRPKEG